MIKTHLAQRKKWALLALIAIIGQFQEAEAQVGIGTSLPDTSAMLEVSSQAKGILIPRLSLAERQQMVQPATGVMIFQTDNTPGFYYNSGTSATPNWQLLLPQNGNGSGLSQLNASALASGVVNPARLGSGTADNTTYLRGDGTWSTISGGSNLPAQTGNSGRFLSTDGATLSWSNHMAFKSVIPIALVNNGTTTINISSTHYNSLLLLNFTGIANTNIQINLPAPSVAGNGARFKLTYVGYSGSVWNQNARTAQGSLYGSTAVVGPNVNTSGILTSEYYCDGVNWYEIPQA